MYLTELDLADPNQQCPPNFRLYTKPKRRCGKSTDGNGCDSAKFTTNDLQYNKVCGRVVGYELGSPDGFGANYCSDCNINKPYVDGIVITHSSPRKHIWTLAAAHSSDCPCNSAGAGAQPPSFVGSDYYCESGGDPLWDGEGCDGNEAPCCKNSPDLGSCKELPEPTSDDLEVCICTDQPVSDELHEFNYLCKICSYCMWSTHSPESHNYHY